MEHTIDAQGKYLGRLATQIAHLLQGKHKAGYNPRVDTGDRVRVSRVNLIKISGKKYEAKTYHRHTGYMGHLKTVSYRQKFESDPAWVLRHAVRGMLPKNKMLAKRLKRLIIER